MRDALGSAMVQMDLFPEVAEGDLRLRMVGLFCKNRWEWCVTEQACNAYGGVTVALYDTQGTDAAAFVIGQTEMRTIFISATEFDKVVEIKRNNPESCEKLENVVVFDPCTKEQEGEAEGVGLRLLSFSNLLEEGRKDIQRHRPPHPDDVATLCYTSGTTGTPKGAMLTHGNITGVVAGGMLVGIQVGPQDVHLSYLPLAHMFERVVQAIAFASGTAIGFFQGNTLKIVDDLKVLRPTIFPSVPRLYNKIYDKIIGGVRQAGGIKEAMFDRAFAAKQYWLQRNYIQYGFWDTLVFNGVKAKVGLDRVHLMITGSAPIAPHVMEFLRIVFGCPVVEGYGQTECGAACTVTDVGDQASMGHVGNPLPSAELKLVSVEDMEYSVTDEYHGRVVNEDGTVVNPGVRCYGRGEICYRGPTIFKGYFRAPEKTAEALDEDGWLHSGDIGMFDELGRLRIIDRLKNIFKLSQGEYVAAEAIENVYTRSDFVAQAFVYGDSFQSCLVAIIVPDADKLAEWAKQNGREGESMESLCADDEVKRTVFADMERVGVEGRLKGFERVRAIHLAPEAFSVDNDMLTPTFKLKRNVARDKFRQEIDAMYASGIGVVAGKSGLRQGEAAGAGEAAAGGGGASGK